MPMFDKAPSQKLMKSMNQQKVLNLIYSAGHISRVELAEKTGLTQQTITNIVNRLLAENIVMEGTPQSSSGGRRPIPLRINHSLLYAIGVEVTFKYVRGVVINFQREIISESVEPVAYFRDEQHTLKCITQVIDRLLARTQVKERVKGIGLSIQGLVDSRQGIVLLSEKMKWKNYRLMEELERRYDYPIYIENDVNILALLENMDGLLVSSENNITLKFDEGIGGAIVCHKQLYTGSAHVAGEFGHYKAFDNEQAKPCPCGGQGCLTAIASLGALQETTGMPIRQLAQKAAAGDPELNALLQTIGAAIARALANLITFLNPDHVLLTGALLKEAGSLLLPRITEEVGRQIPIHCRNVRIVHLAQTPDHAGIAAGLVIKQMFAPPVSTLQY